MDVIAIIIIYGIFAPIAALIGAAWRGIKRLTKGKSWDLG